jgi:hypothetical protein
MWLQNSNLSTHFAGKLSALQDIFGKKRKNFQAFFYGGSLFSNRCWISWIARKCLNRCALGLSKGIPAGMCWQMRQCADVEAVAEGAPDAIAVFGFNNGLRWGVAPDSRVSGIRIQCEPPGIYACIHFPDTSGGAPLPSPEPRWGSACFRFIFLATN